MLVLLTRFIRTKKTVATVADLPLATIHGDLN